MWVCLNDAFLSIVAHTEHQDMLLVRARAPGHIETVFGKVAVVEGAGSDYRFRALVPRDEVAAVLSATAKSIDYGNFKDSVEDPQLHDAYMDFWQTMYFYQSDMQRVKSS